MCGIKMCFKNWNEEEIITGFCCFFFLIGVGFELSFVGKVYKDYLRGIEIVF